MSLRSIRGDTYPQQCFSACYDVADELRKIVLYRLPTLAQIWERISGVGIDPTSATESSRHKAEEIECGPCFWVPCRAARHIAKAVP